MRFGFLANCLQPNGEIIGRTKRESVMKRYQLCMSLSLTIALAQATSPVSAGNSTIWEQLSGTPNPATQATKRQSPHSVATPARSLKTNRPHSMLVLNAANSKVDPFTAAPATASSIHQELSDAVGSIPSRSISSNLRGESADAKQLLAQLAPDSLVAQGDASGGAPSVVPIPPVVSGTVDMEEFKASNIIDLKVSQSRTFKSKNKIVRTSISDPAIAEPVVVAENQIVLLGKTPGTATMVLWDDAGNSVAIDLRVTRDYSLLQSTLREIDPRIVVKVYSVGGTDRIILLGDVDHAESLIRAFATAATFMDDRGMQISVANNRFIGARVGEQGAQGAAGGGGGQTGQLASLSSVDKYTFFSNLNNNISTGQLITTDGGRVTSLVKVRKVPLIVLHCTFLEMNTAAARALGLQLGLNFNTATFGFGLGGAAPTNTSVIVPLSYPGYQVNGVNTELSGFRAPGFVGATSQIFATLTQAYTGVGQGAFALAAAPPGLIPASAIFGAPGGTTFSSAATSLLNDFVSGSNWRVGHGAMGLNPAIEGSIEHNRARILAEPTLVTISGERASFLAGGEVPILQQLATAGQALQSVTFEPFGLRLNIIPTLQENGTINLEISPEERVLSTANALIFAGSATPIDSFTTRKLQTIVELRPGQEIYLGGLISSNNGREVDKTPVLGEVPVLGALYRSKAFSKNESELVISVRPEIILPGTPGQLKLPEEIGRVEGPRDVNLFQVEPTVIDERYFTSGRAERQQKTSPTLPEGSPVPDNR
jgi:Flp pilus assembly secretin CpaC